MLTQFRLALCALALTGALWAGTAAAQWPWEVSAIARLEPGYGGVCEDCDLSGRILAGAKMSNAVFNRSDFSHAVLARANAAHTRFADVDFSDADLRALNAEGADFSRAVFAGADVTSMNIAGAILTGADLRDARGLTQLQLDRACGDDQTRVPRGLRVRRC